ncbi:MAG TPA: TlpA disulfide reductase family protein [Opitutaceae bacterium]|nr:TlpA disulfide reductase family protein [Opitutaceae bacterium]
MKCVRLVPGILCVALSLGVAGCGPKKEPAPPAPKVTAKEEPAPQVAPKENAAKTTIAALPKLGEAPAWKLTDVNGQVVSSEDLKGKVVVVDFWATWCGPCRQEIPGYIELAKKYGKDGLVIVGVSLDQEGPAVVKAFGQKFGVSYPLVMADDDVQKAFGGLEVIPTTFLIDREGQVRDRKIGAVETAEYEQRILSVLKAGAE